MNSKNENKIMKWAEKVDIILDENGIWHNTFYNEEHIMVHIPWGDWKHDHLRCDYLLGNLGLTCVNTEVTEEDGSDCYSAVHYYR